MSVVEIRRLPDGRIQARRKDGKPMTDADRAEARRLAASKPGALDLIVDERCVACLIDSTVMGAPLWFAFDPSFDPGDGIPVFYADELGLLKNKPAATLRKIYETKKRNGPGTRVRQ